LGEATEERSRKHLISCYAQRSLLMADWLDKLCSAIALWQGI